MIRFAIGIIFILISFTQLDPASRWGMLLFGLGLMIWDGVDSNGEKLDAILRNQAVINKNVREKPQGE